MMWGPSKMPNKPENQRQWKPGINYYLLSNGYTRIRGHVIQWPSGESKTYSVLINPGHDVLGALIEFENTIREARAEQQQKKHQHQLDREVMMAKAIIQQAEIDEAERRRIADIQTAKVTAIARKDVEVVRKRYGMADTVVYINVYGEGVMA